MHFYKGDLKLMKQATLRGGIVGCGAVLATTHMPAWRTVKGVEIVAISDQKEEAAMEAAKRWDIPTAYRDFSQMLNREKLDFVDISTPPQTHYQLAIQATEAGVHVLVEKPMAVELSQAEEMVSAAKKYGVKLCVAHNILFSPVVQKAKSLVDNGAIGELLAIDLHSFELSETLSQQNSWFHSLPGGIFGEYAPHPVYLLLAFLNNIRSVRVVTRKYSDYSWVAADELKVLVEGENGLGSFTVSCNSPRIFFTLDLLGTKGDIYIDHINQIMIQRQPRSVRLHDLILDRLDLTVPVFTAGISGVVSRIRGQVRTRIGHRVIFKRFVESIRNNTDTPVTGEDGRETVKVLEEIWKQIG